MLRMVLVEDTGHRQGLARSQLEKDRTALVADVVAGVYCSSCVAMAGRRRVVLLAAARLVCRQAVVAKDNFFVVGHMTVCCLFCVVDLPFGGSSLGLCLPLFLPLVYQRNGRDGAERRNVVVVVW